MRRVISILILLVLSVSMIAQRVSNNEKSWAWLNFERPAGVNPIISPDATSQFFCPMRQTAMKWEESDTFNPAATVINGRIVVLYRAEDNTANSYCAGQVLFDKKDPTKVIDRLDEPFFIPEADFEKSGQYPAGTVFIEGLVPMGGKWFLYYGCADSRVSVAVREE